MKVHASIILITLLTASHGQTAPIAASVNTGVAQMIPRSTAAADVSEAAKVMAAPGSDEKEGAIVNLRKELPGTKWKAVPNVALRGGLVGLISFTEKTVEPGGYQYESLSRSLTMTFTHGAKQSLELSRDGKHLQYPRGEIVYERVRE